MAAAWIAAAATVAACTRVNGLYCEQEQDCDPGWSCDLLKRECIFHGRDAGWDGEGCADSTRCPAETPICSADHECGACVAGADGDADCAARDPATATCRSDGRCVACLDDDGCTQPDADFCDQASGLCRGCLAHDECASEVCNIGQGDCTDPAAVVYVDNVNGADGSACGTQAAPCASLTGADGGLAKVAAGRRTVRLRAGQGYAEALDLDAVAVILVGPGAVLQPVSPDRAAIAARNGASVTIDGLQVTGADGVTLGDGVRCSDAGTVVRIDRATISDNQDVGVEVEAGCDLRMSRTLVLRNGGGGVRTLADTFDLTHSIIAGNGGGASTFGGLRLAPGGTGTRRVEFLTVAGNTAGSGAAGVQCTTALPVGSSIVWGNSGPAQVAAMCAATYCDVQGGAAGTGNIDADPLFVSVDDLHLTAASPCVDAADPGAAATVDIDGDLRPRGAGRDIGADEAQ